MIGRRIQHVGLPPGRGSSPLARYWSTMFGGAVDGDKALGHVMAIATDDSRPRQQMLALRSLLAALPRSRAA